MPTQRLISDLLRLLLEGDTARATALLAAAAAHTEEMCTLLVQSKLAGHFHMLAGELPLQDYLPAAGIAALEAAAAQQLARASRCRALLPIIDQQLTAAGIPYLLLKGLYLAQRFFGDMDKRFMWDVDILVRPQDLDLTVQALARAGLNAPAHAQLDTRNRIWGIHAIDVRGDAGAVDIHHTIRRLPGIQFDSAEMWQQAQTFTVAGVHYQTLSDLDTLLIVAVGLGTDIQTGKHNLKKVWDLYMILRALDQGTDWDAFLAGRSSEGSLKLVLNVLAFCLLLLDASSDCPRLAQALDRRRELLLVESRQQALAIYGRPRRHLGNRLLFSRLLPVSMPRYWAGRSLTLPARLWHYRKPGKPRPG
ncbi:nucleotidyltransferase family protein [Haliea sp. E1-2-M8]|uniref:nucleotidyltransferase family protein n=1 Tax=Haliea sp. E1-2-M8 TaxID=3064706 RepID=UPI00272433D5|nr:nucleotidyltransferase family protein [Haliea sp. E1-2-M8]MDO8863397.1 nucleotidyltransferase family protein [Haliea sp. E1-2-M8]